MLKEKIIPFDLSKVTDDNVFTKSGRKVRIICTDKKSSKDCPIVALITTELGDEECRTYNPAGQYVIGDDTRRCNLVLHVQEEVDTCADLKPFDKVLVRDHLEYPWIATFFSHISSDPESRFKYRCTGGQAWAYCIPYEGNEALLGTANSPKE